MTEEEAKAKRCCGPMGCGSAAPGTTDHADGVRFCIGSACMAWRWVSRAPGTPPRADEPGFCGKAGKP